MFRRVAGKKALWVFTLSLLLLLAAITAWGCTKSEPVEPSQEQKVEEGEEEGIKEETVALTLYFRYNTGTREWLAPQERTVPGVTDPYRAAMEELIKGPTPDSQLYPVLPNTVKVLEIGVADGVCTVNVSKEILTDANQVGVSASGEELALSAIADTLTEFEEVSKVKLLIEGVQSGMVEGRFVEDFWGHMGLPEYLERNEDIIYKESS